MSKILVERLISLFERMRDEHWDYVEGGSDLGKVDCSGAFVWAYKQLGSNNIYHGSNRIAREHVLKLYPIGSVEIVPGMAAFKHRTPMDPGYKLPSSYKPGGSHYNGDLNDYYHIGLIDNNTAKVLNAQSSSTGFVSSDISKGWSHVAYLTQVDYQNSGSVVQDTTGWSDSKNDGLTDQFFNFAKVVAEVGSAVKMRRTPSKSERFWENVAVGTVVEITGKESNGWYPIRYGSKSGYMMAEYLEPVSINTSTDQDISEKRFSVTIVDLNQEEAETLLKQYPGRSFQGESNG